MWTKKEGRVNIISSLRRGSTLVGAIHSLFLSSRAPVGNQLRTTRPRRDHKDF